MGVPDQDELSTVVTFGNAQRIVFENLYIYGLVVIDLDLDGDLDFGVRTSPRSSGLGEPGVWRQVLQQDDHTYVLAAEPLPLHDGPAVVADFNADGHEDLLLTGYPIDDPAAPLRVLLLSGGQVLLDQPASTASSGEPCCWPLSDDASQRDSQIVDLDGDGDLDVVARCRLADRRGVICTYLLDDAHFIDAGYTLLDYEVEDIAIADLTGDGVPDIAVFMGDSDWPGGSIQLLIGEGDGTFTVGDTIPLADEDAPSDIETADVDLDGDVDVLCHVIDWSTRVLDPGPDFSEFPSSFLLCFDNDGHGGLTRSARIGLCDSAYRSGLHVVDLNHDLLPDVVGYGYADETATRVAVVMNGREGFSSDPLRFYAAGMLDMTFHGSLKFAFADIDGDGWTDIAASIHGYFVGPAVFRYWRNPRNAAFEGTGIRDAFSEPSYDWTYDLQTEYFRARDFDGDGRIDFCVPIGRDFGGDGEPYLLVAFNQTEPPQAFDCDGNGRPDECDDDRDGDGLIDGCDKLPRRVESRPGGSRRRRRGGRVRHLPRSGEITCKPILTTTASAMRASLRRPRPYARSSPRRY